MVKRDDVTRNEKTMHDVSPPTNQPAETNGFVLENPGTNWFFATSSGVSLLWAQSKDAFGDSHVNSCSPFSNDGDVDVD